MFTKQAKRFTKKVQFNMGDRKKITKTEVEVLNYLTEDFLTIKQIAKRRQTTERSVYKIRQNLITKGYLTILNQPLKKRFTKRGGHLPSQGRSNKSNSLGGGNSFVAAQQFRIELLGKGKRYEKLIGTYPKLEGVTIQCSRNTLFLSSNLEFRGKDIHEAWSEAVNFWESFFPRLEHYLGVYFYKEGKQNIRLVRQKLGQGNSKIVKRSRRSGKEIKVYDWKDFKLSVFSDHSHGGFDLHEVHPETNLQDADAIERLISDVARHKVLPSENYELITKLLELFAKNTLQLSELIRHSKNTAEGLEVLIEILKRNRE